MANNLPPRLKRWGTIGAMIVGIVWLALNPDMVWEELDKRGVSPSRQVDKPYLPQRKPAKTSTNEVGFDFYVLALSWSPSFCASKNRKTGLQCGGKRFYSFIVHGLWPQYEKGWPSNCDVNARRVGKKLVNAMLDIMPGEGLIQHQWKKHGTCSSLGQNDYFAKLRAAYEKIRFPAHLRLNNRYLTTSPTAIERAFQDENPGLAANAIAVTCGKRRLREVRICLSKDLKFRACKQVDKNSCRRDKIVMPPVRGTG
jgi:ribonuclease T2